MTARARARALIASDEGTFNLVSIIVGAVLTLALVAGLTVGLPRLLPWGQDMNAREDLAAVRTAEATARAKDGRYMDDAVLKTAGWIDVKDRAVVGTDPAGSCFVAIVKSGSGKFFYITDKNAASQIITAATDTGCLEPSAGDQLRARIGAPTPSFGPLENGGFEEGFKDWAIGSVNGGGPPALVTSTQASLRKDGENSARLYPGSYVEQGIRVPAGATRFTYWASAQGVSAETTVTVRNRSGEQVGELDVPPTARGWAQTGADLSGYAGQDVTVRIGFPEGQPNVDSVIIDLVESSTTVPPAPSLVLGYTRNAGASITWDAPATGGASITSYVAFAYRAGQKEPEATVHVPRTSTKAVFTGLANGVNYTFTVRAVNVLGASAESAPSPAYLVADNLISNHSFEGGMAAWTAGSTTGGDAPALTTVSGAGWDGTYRLFLGPGQYVEQTVTVPSADGMVSLSQQAQSAGGYSSSSAAADVSIYSADGVLVATVPGLPAPKSAGTVRTDLTAYRGQTLTLRFSYRDISGSNGVYLDNLRFETGVTPAPVINGEWASDRTAHLLWSPPEYGSASVTSYRITAYTGSKAVAEMAAPGDATGASFAGLTNGTSYTFKLSAVNGTGASPLSSASQAVTVADHAVLNGGFEGGLQAWDTGAGAGSAIPTVDGTQKSAGRGSAILPKGSSVRQSMRIREGTAATLTLQSYLIAGDGSIRGTVLIEVYSASSGNLLASVTSTPRNRWGASTLDLSAHTGSAVVLKITNMSSGVQSARVDEVSLTVR